MIHSYQVIEIGHGPVGTAWVTRAAAERYARGLQSAHPGRRYEVRSRIENLATLVQRVA